MSAGFQPWAAGGTASDRLGSARRNQHRQNGGSIANVSRYCHERFRYGRVFVRKSLKARTDAVELLNLAQDRFKRHGVHCFLGRKA